MATAFLRLPFAVIPLPLLLLHLDPTRERGRDGRTVAPEDLVGPGQVEEVVHLPLALWQVDAQALLRLLRGGGGTSVPLRCCRRRRRRGRFFHNSLLLHDHFNLKIAEKKMIKR